jgi:hypothetical protein
MTMTAGVPPMKAVSMHGDLERRLQRAERRYRPYQGRSREEIEEAARDRAFIGTATWADWELLEGPLAAYLRGRALGTPVRPPPGGVDPLLTQRHPLFCPVWQIMEIPPEEPVPVNLMPILKMLESGWRTEPDRTDRQSWALRRLYMGTTEDPSLRTLVWAKRRGPQPPPRREVPNRPNRLIGLSKFISEEAFNKVLFAVIRPRVVERCPERIRVFEHEQYRDECEELLRVTAKEAAALIAVLERDPADAPSQSVQTVPNPCQNRSDPVRTTAHQAFTTEYLIDRVVRRIVRRIGIRRPWEDAMQRRRSTTAK